MSDDVALIRGAARLMRERAQAATPGPWLPDGSEIYSQFQGGPWVGETLKTGEAQLTDADAEHIASWHPDVALAVAGLLDSLADLYTAREAEPMPLPLPLARIVQAYLGRSDG